MLPFDVPARFRHSKSVGALFGLTPLRKQSGETDRRGAISRCGDAMMRTTLYEAAHSILVHSTRWSGPKALAMKIARHSGKRRAVVALARCGGNSAPHLGRRHRVRWTKDAVAA